MRNASSQMFCCLLLSDSWIASFHWAISVYDANTAYGTDSAALKGYSSHLAFSEITFIYKYSQRWIFKQIYTKLYKIGDMCV